MINYMQYLCLVETFTCSIKQLAVFSTEPLLSSNRPRNILYSMQKTTVDGVYANGNSMQLMMIFELLT